MARIAFHVIRNTPFSNPNRGRDGMPKDMIFGNVRRGRLSSQSQGRRVRRQMEKGFGEKYGMRTCTFADEVVKKMQDNNPKLSANEADQIRQAVSRLWRNTKEEKNEDESQKTQKTQIMHIAARDVELIAEEISKFSNQDKENYNIWLDPSANLMDKFEDALANTEYTDEDKEKITKVCCEICDKVRTKEDAPVYDPVNASDEFVRFAIEWVSDEYDKCVATGEKKPLKFLPKKDKTVGVPSALLKKAQRVMKNRLGDLKKRSNIFATGELLDVAFFGRYPNDLGIDGVTGAMTVSHAHAVNEFVAIADFFVAMSDNASNKGAAHMGERWFHSSCYYQFFVLDLEQLKENYSPYTQDLDKILQELMRWIYHSLPTGLSLKTGSNFAEPQLILAEVYGDGVDEYPVSYFNAFDPPCRGVGGEGLQDEAVRRLETYAAKYAVSRRVRWSVHYTASKLQAHTTNSLAEAGKKLTEFVGSNKSV